MGPLDLLTHLLNFLAPAFFLAAALPWCARWLFRQKTSLAFWARQFALNFVAGTLILVVGLWFFGHDGKMATYTALVLACSSCQWLAGRHWR